MYLFQVMSSCKVRVLMKLLCSSAFFMPACYRTEISGKVTTAPDASILLSGFRHHRDSVMVPGKKIKMIELWWVETRCPGFPLIYSPCSSTTLQGLYLHFCCVTGGSGSVSHIYGRAHFSESPTFPEF